MKVAQGFEYMRAEDPEQGYDMMLRLSGQVPNVTRTMARRGAITLAQEFYRKKEAEQSQAAEPMDRGEYLAYQVYTRFVPKKVAIGMWNELVATGRTFTNEHGVVQTLVIKNKVYTTRDVIGNALAFSAPQQQVDATRASSLMATGPAATAAPMFAGGGNIAGSQRFLRNGPQDQSRLALPAPPSVAAAGAPGDDDDDDDDEEESEEEEEEEGAGDMEEEEEEEESEESNDPDADDADEDEEPAHHPQKKLASKDAKRLAQFTTSLSTPTKASTEATSTPTTPLAFIRWKRAAQARLLKAIEESKVIPNTFIIIIL